MTTNIPNRGIPPVGLEELVWRLRRLFQRLASEASDLHADLGITAAQRAVLEFLDREEPQTVPQMARRRSVSRQHIQAVANDLLARGLLQAEDNPAHRRSPLLRRSREGRARFETLRARERAAFAVLAEGLDAAQIGQATRLLAEIEHRLASGAWTETKRRLIDAGGES